MVIKQLVFKVADTFFSFLPLKNVIMLHSIPLMTDNTQAVYDEMVRRGLNRKYKFVWICEKNDIGTVVSDNTVIVHKHSSMKERLLKLYYEDVAKIMIDCNGCLRKGNRKHKQIEFYLMHGSSTKRVTHYYTMPSEVDYTVSLSNFFKPYDAENLAFNDERVVALGYPRSDWLFKKNVDLKVLFHSHEFDKVIYWMPTFRQHKGDESLNFSDINFPIVYNKEIAERINECACSNRVLIIAKPHYVQDFSKIEMLNLSNFVFINDLFLKDHGVQNYELLGCVDALLSDYSSVYVDFMLCDKPIGLCWDDYDEFSKREGFLFDEHKFFAGGEKIFNVEDLCDFIVRIGECKDVLTEERHSIMNTIHDYTDNNNSKRVVDFILDAANNVRKNLK